MIKRTLVVGVCLLMTGGCAGTLAQIIDRPIESDHLDEVGEYNKLKTLSGDRRLIRVAAELGSGRQIGDQVYFTYDVCGETQADAITARGASSQFSVAEQGSLNDASTQTLTLTNTRGAVSDVVRQLSWHLCNARMNNDLTVAEYRDAMLALTYNSMAVLQQAEIAANARVVPLQGAPDWAPAVLTPVSPPPAAAPQPPPRAPQ